MPLARISLTLSRHFSISFIASGRSSGLQGYIPYLHIAAECMFVLVALFLPGHMWGSIGVHHLWARPCFSRSIYTFFNGLFNAKWLLCKCFITIIIIFIFLMLLLFVFFLQFFHKNHSFFTWLYNIKHSYLILISYSKLYCLIYQFILSNDNNFMEFVHSYMISTINNSYTFIWFGLVV